MTAPRFLGYQFNPVSFWYLYGDDRHLRAMILEVNNTFDERRMYFLTSEPVDNQPASEGEQGKCPARSRSRQHVFRQSWAKDFHVSPFNSRKGSYTLTATDPLDPSMRGTCPVSLAIKLVSSKGHIKMVAALSSQGATIDPCTMTSSQQIRFLASWWWVGLLTYPRILLQALRLFFHRRLHVWHTPHPLPGTIPRRATLVEQYLEPIFRRYLEHLLEHAPAGLALKYTPATGDTTTTQVIQPKRHLSTAPVETADITVLTPSFYPRFIRYTNPLEAFLTEATLTDNNSTISISHPDLLAKLTAESAGCQQYRVGGRNQTVGAKLLPQTRGSLAARTCLGMIRRLHSGGGSGTGTRTGKGVLSAVDGYVLAHERAGVVGVYGWCVLRLGVEERVPWVLLVLLRVGVAWVVGLGLEGVCLGVWRLLLVAIRGVVVGTCTWVGRGS